MTKAMLALRGAAAAVSSAGHHGGLNLPEGLACYALLLTAPMVVAVVGGVE